MSWSISAVGKASAVAEACEKQFKAMEAYPCPEPEESAKQAIRQMIARLCAAQSRPNAMAVKVSAAGSMSWSNNQTEPKEVANTVSFTFDSLWGFVE